MSDDQIRVMPEDFGGLQWKDVTNIHPLGLAAVLVLGVSLLFLPRRWAMLPMVLIVCFIPTVQQISILTLDFNLLRIMILFGVTRLLSRGEYRGFRWKPIDRVMILYCFCATVVPTIRSGSAGALVYGIGLSYTALGMYFLVRCLVRTWEDVDHLILGFIVTSVPVAIAFAAEWATQHNAFSVFGGVPAITMVRDGKLRCQGAFSHPILAGCFWASMAPLFASRWWKNPTGKKWAVTGVLSVTFIVFACHSSTPLSGLIAAGVGGLAFFWRYKMRTVRWSILISLIVLHLVKERPVWSLIDVASGLGGGGGYHRYKLLDSAITYFSEWWLLGTTSTAHWFWGAQDVTMQYVLEGVQGGLVTLALFIAIIVLGFRMVGRLWRLCVSSPHRLALSWALGISLFVHCVNFLGVSYFGQGYFVWYLVLGVIGSLGPVAAEPYRRVAWPVDESSRLRSPAGQLGEAVGASKPYVPWESAKAGEVH